MRHARDTTKTVGSFLWKYKFHIAGLVVVALWCYPYFQFRETIEWGDFSFFAQAYEAMRISILDYGQFPWWNPWISGGVPLYANPQIGVFSIQALLVLIFGSVIGLKLAVAFYTFAGVASMYLLLRKYFKIDSGVSILISLIWVMSSFFVAHLPSHFTFVWYMLIPLYVYLALTLKDWRGGLLLGVAMAIMALSAVHNPFFHIGLVVGLILLVRFIRSSKKKAMLLGFAATAGAFLVLAGHRVYFTVQNALAFPRELEDPAGGFKILAGGLITPYSVMDRVKEFIHYPLGSVYTPFGFGEVTSTIGLAATFAAFLGIIYIVYTLTKYEKMRQKLTHLKRFWPIATIIIALGILAFIIGLGDFSPWSPYALLKSLPVIGGLRVSSRWFIWVSLCLLLLVAVVYQRSRSKSFFRTAVIILLIIGTVELFSLNFGYQNRVTRQKVTKPDDLTLSLPFAQTSKFGAAKELPDGTKLPFKGKGLYYREYEATLFNLGVIQANDALITNLSPEDTPLCGWEKGCGFILSNNAELTSWSPNKIVLKRTNSGTIKLNMNDSNYLIINGERQQAPIADPHNTLALEHPDETIVIIAQPAIRP